MKSIHKNKLYKSAAILLTVVFVLLAMNKSLYSHTHLDKNGNLVSHSHPYNKSGDSQPVKQHHHSVDFLLSLTLLEGGISFLFIFKLAIFLLFKIIPLDFGSIVKYPESFIRYPVTRGPPVYLFC